MAKKKKGPLPPRTDAELIGRLREMVPDILTEEVDFETITDAILKFTLENKPCERSWSSPRKQKPKTHIPDRKGN
jgi:hypothetical protein